MLQNSFCPSNATRDELKLIVSSDTMDSHLGLHHAACADVATLHAPLLVVLHANVDSIRSFHIGRHPAHESAREEAA